MQKNEYEIIVLKPTDLFRTFLGVIRPDIKWPSLSLFQKDATAYSLKKSDSDDQLIEQMQEYFLDMFQHEVSKWVGEAASEMIHISFFDFLRFFKFEHHTELMLMESSVQAGRHMLRIKPRTVVFKRNVQDKPSVKSINYYQPAQHTTVIIKKFK